MDAFANACLLGFKGEIKREIIKKRLKGEGGLMNYYKIKNKPVDSLLSVRGAVSQIEMKFPRKSMDSVFLFASGNNN